ncbi:MAG: PAS domain S-box protein, partial [Cyanobacteria bacterium KgW148]|nr:PAS domain S-box protein [Cyanobacteria bacterium KgW148]
MVRKILPALLGLIVISGLGTGLIFWQLRSSYRSRIIKKLEQATQSIPHILGKDYLDKIKDKKSVTDAEYQVVLDKLENYVKDVGEIIYIYVYTLDENDRVVEVADTPSAIEKIEESPFFSEYRSAPPILINILKDGDSFTPRIVQAGDEYGDFLSCLQLYQNSGGKKFLLGADIELSLVKQNLWRLFYLSLAISITGTIAYGFVIYLFRDNTRKNVASLFVFITIFLVVLTITAKEYRQKIEDRLFMAARTVPEILGEAYIDRAIKPESVSPEEFKTVIQRINNFTATIGVTYAFALRKQGDKIVYIADSTTTEELAQGFFAGYWGEYDTSPDLILPLFEEPGKVTGSYQDEYGSFRSVFYSRYDSNNNIVVFGADLAQNKLRQERIIKFLSVLLVTIGYSSLLLLWHHQSLQFEGIPKQLFWKTVIISSSSIVIFLAAFYLFTQGLLYDSYNKLEGDELRSEIDRFKRLIEEEKRFISLRFADWAGWDDAYQFVQDGNQSFRKSNLIPDVAITLRINLLLYLNLDKEVVGGVTYNAITGKEEPQLTDKFRAYLEQHPPFFNFKSIKEKQSNIGLVNLDGEKFILAVLPVLRSDLSGTTKGFFVAARKLDQISISEIARRQNLNLRIYGIEEASAIDRFQPIVNEIIETGNDHVNSSTDNFIYGYTVLKDIENQPVFFVRIVRKRDIFLKGKDIVDRVLLIALIGFGIVILSTNLIILQTSVLSRLLRLVQNLENQRNLPPDRLEKIPTSGNDEISYLIQTFNELLETNRRNNEKFMKIFRTSPTAIMIVKIDDGQISEVNSGFENLFGYTAKEVIGKNIAEFGGWLLGADADKIMATEQSNDFLRNIEVSIQNREGKQITCNLSTEIIVISETSYILYNLS